MATDLSAAGAAAIDQSEAQPARRRRWRFGVLAVAVLASAVVAFTATRQATGAGEARDQFADEGAAPAFDLPRVGMPKDRVSLAQFAGRPVVVNFWASWCVPCRKEMPALEAVAERLAGRVTFVGVNSQDAPTPAAEFEAEVGVRYPSGSDPDGGVARDYGVLGLPTTVLVDGAGMIVARRLGELTEQELLELIDRAFDLAGRERPA